MNSKKTSRNTPKKTKSKRKIQRYIAYTDGSSSGTCGGIAYVIISPNGKNIVTLDCAYVEHCTAPQAELLALTEVLRWYDRKGRKNNYVSGIDIYSDAKYVVNGYNEWMKNWAKNNWDKPIANKLMWQKVYALSLHEYASVSWVQGHNGNPWNTLVDYLATQCRTNGYTNTEKMKEAWTPLSQSISSVVSQRNNTEA